MSKGARDEYAITVMARMRSAYLVRQTLLEINQHINATDTNSLAVRWFEAHWHLYRVAYHPVVVLSPFPRDFRGFRALIVTALDAILSFSVSIVRSTRRRAA